MSNDPPIHYQGQTLVDNPAFWELINGDYLDLTQIKEFIAEAYLVETGETNATDKTVSSLLFSNIAGNLDVVWPEFDVRWVGRLGIEPIDLTPYLESGPPSEGHP